LGAPAALGIAALTFAFFASWTSRGWRGVTMTRRAIRGVDVGRGAGARRRHREWG
jgi:hypothetical protein